MDADVIEIRSFYLNSDGYLIFSGRAYFIHVRMIERRYEGLCQAA